MLLIRCLIMPLLLWLSALSLLLAGCSDSASLAKPYYHQVEATPIQLQQRYQISNAYPGRVEAPQRFDMGFDAQGKIIEILVDVGDEITQGQLLARLDTGLLDAERLSVLAQRQEKQAQLKLIGIELRRQEELREQEKDRERDRRRQEDSASRAAAAETKEEAPAQAQTSEPEATEEAES
mgnify:CR=1 FL=1